jgi:type IV secretory pathway VirB10-like protein
MSDLFQLEPNIQAKPSMQPQPQVAAVQRPPESPVGTAAGWTKDKTVLVAIVAVVIVLVICLIYWYVSKPADTHQTKQLAPTPAPKPQTDPKDNIPDQPLPPLKPNEPSPPSTPSKEPKEPKESKESKEQKTGGSAPTHTSLVMTTDDDELDKYINPSEPDMKSLGVNPGEETESVKPTPKDKKDKKDTKDTKDTKDKPAMNKNKTKKATKATKQATKDDAPDVVVDFQDLDDL